MREARIAVVVPTLNEAASAPDLVRGLYALGLDLAVWILDDGSRDGTVEALRPLAAGLPTLHVVSRAGRPGYGRAVSDGLARALAAGAEVLVQMDADLSHDPRQLPGLLAALDGADLALGSRYLNGVSVVNWPLRRLALSVGANAYVRVLAGLPVRDCTTGFRAWRRELLERIDLPAVRSEGYSFLVETLFRAVRAGGRVAEAPIVFVERKAGASKLGVGVFVESALLPWRLLAARLLRPGGRR